MEVKLGLGAPAPHILYPGTRQPPPGPPAAHPPPTSRITARGERLGLAKSDGHDGSPYKTPISPPMASRAGAGGYPAYPPSGDTHSRYMQPPPIQQPPPPPFVAYQRDQSHYVRNTDRPMMLPHGPRRPTIMGNYGPYSRAEAEMLWPYTHSHPRTDMMSIVPGNPLAISTTIDSSKRMKLSQQMKPLVVDTSENNHSSRESTYTPQVEAISPTLPSDPRDESPLRTTKDDLLKRIEKVDRDIAKAESSIAKLRKKEGELEAAAQKGEGGKTEEEDTKEPKHQSLAQIIYADNRKKAEESHTILDKLMPPTEEPSVLPLYHQPTDTEVYMENKRQYAGFKRRLMEYFKKRHADKNSRDAHLTQTYSKLMTEWLKKVEKVENSKKHKEKVAKNRELFEKVFPELRKQREEKERFSRVGARVKSDAEMEEIMDGLQEQENEDKKMRAYAVIPPILLEEKKRQHRYNNRNGLIEEPIAEYKDHKNINIWTEQEKEIFRDKYLQHPKNFVAIGSYLERKSVSDCIQYYYSTKKKENYKVLVKRRIRRPRKPNNPPVVEVVGVNVTGVTTRGSVAALRGQQTNRQGPPTMTGSLNNNSNSNQGSSGESEQTQNYPVNSTPGGEVSANSLPATTENSPVPSPNHAATVGVSQGNESSNNSGTNTAPAISNQEVREKDKENLSNSDKPREKPARRERLLKEDDKTKDTQDSSDDDNAAEHGKGGPHECVVCNAQLEHFGQSRPVAAGQASRYGLSEAHLPPNPRVCTSCKCRATRVRVRQFCRCPIPTCPTPKWRGKRLRPLPSRWADLPPQVKEPIIKEFQIPSDCTKCCSACHNRITRKLGPDAEEPVDPSRWSDEDLDALRSALREVGCHWSKVAERVPSKTEGQCKSFYFNFKKKYKFDEIVAEYRKARGKGDGPPTVTDEEESGSSTSSCDEGPLPALPAGPDSDTTSAPSPGPAHQNNIDAEKRETAGPGEGLMKEPPPPPQPPSVREDYDSSATASADEGQSGAGRDSPEVQHIPHPGERKPQHPPAHAKLAPTPPTNIVQNPDPSNVRDLIYIAIEKSLEDPCSSNINSKDLPTIESILKDSNLGRGQPPQSLSAPARRDFHREQRLHAPGRYNDPRDGLPPSDPGTLDAQDTQCEGLDLSVRKRDRSPPPKQPPAHHAHPAHFHHPPQPHQPHPPHPPHPPHQPHQPPPPPPAAPLSRDLPLTVRGGAELTITSKEPPPQAHSNSASSYSKPPSHEPWPYADLRNKSPSAFIADARALPHPASSIMANVAPSGAQPLVYVRPQHTQSSKSKPSMAPPPPLTVRSQHSAQQPVSVASRISVKAEKPLHVGSITHGTPVNPPPIVSVPITQPARFDMMPKSGMGKEGGSITQGTPMHHEQKRISANLYKDVVYEPRPGSGVEIIPRPSLNPQYEREHSYRGPRPPISSAPPTTTYPYTSYPYAARPPYSESQISSRQIIANDYITSQQMHGRRTVSEKEARVSPRGRDHSPQSDPRDHRTLPGTTSVSRIMEARAVDPRAIDIRTVDHRGLDPRMAHSMDPRIYYPGGPPHGSYQPPAQPSAPVYHPVDRVSRPPPSPASARDATPTPPTSDPAPSPHDFRSPGVSTPTPPPRVGVIQRRPTSKPPPHAVPPKSISPEPNRYSPRHPSGSDTFHAFVDIAVAQRSNVGYPELRRESRPPHPDNRPPSHPDSRPPSHPENRPLEGFEKHFADSVRNKGGYYETVDRHRIAKNPDGKANLEAEVARDMAACFRKDDPKNAQAQKHRNPDETMTAANLIDRIITQQINHNSGDCGTGGGGGGGGGGCSGGSSCGSSGAGGERGGSAGGAAGDQRTYRRDGEVALQVVELDKRVRSPAAPMSKEKEVVMVDDGPEPRLPNPVNHKEGLVVHPHHPGSQPKSMQAHLDQVIHRELSSGDGRKMGAPHMPYGRSFEILRTEGRPLVGSGGPPAVTVSQVGYDPWKMRGHDKDGGKERLESRSPHRPPPTTAPPSSHHLSAQHLAPDERQIIRIAQPVSPRPDHKMRTPPAAPAGSFPVEPISPPTSSAQPPADLNHTDPNPPWQRKRPYPPPPQSKEVFEYVRCKIAEVMRTPETQESDKQRVHDDRRPRSGTPVSQHQQQPPPPPPQQSAPQQNAHYDMEDAAKKRARLEAAERPPSRPRSTGGDMVRDRREEAVAAAAAAAAREEVANSPQSDEMVIDESPRDAHPPSKSGADMGGNKPGGPKGGDCGGDRPSYPPANTVSGSQYPYTYTGFRGHGGPPGAPPPATTASTTSSNANSGRHAQGYEPSVEPVSDDE